MPKDLIYYERGKNRAPVVTVCLHISDESFTRGVAICSPKDNPCKKIGRAIAKGRALKAAKLMETTSNFSECFPILTSFEKRLVEKAIGVVDTCPC